MPDKRLSVVVTRRLPESVETRMSELFDVRLRTDDTKMSRDELAAAMRTADVLVPTVTDQIDAGLLAFGQRSRRTVAVVEATTMGLGIALLTLMGRHIPIGFRPALTMLLVFAVLILSRSILVPSSARRTAWYCLAVEPPLTRKSPASTLTTFSLNVARKVSVLALVGLVSGFWRVIISSGGTGSRS